MNLKNSDPYAIDYSDEQSGGSADPYATDWSKVKPGKKGRPERSWNEAITDTASAAVNAVLGAPEAIGNMIKPGNRVSEVLKQVRQRGEKWDSLRTKEAKAELAEKMNAADSFGEEVGVMLEHAKENPALVAGQAVGSLVGPGAGMKVFQGGAKALGLGEKAVRSAAVIGGSVTGGAMAGGDAAGNAYDLVYEATGDEERATTAGRQASVVPAIIGAIGGRTGMEKTLVEGAAGNILTRTLKGAAKEGLEEGVEEGVTEYSGRKAAQANGVDLDPMKGVGGAATLGTLTGGIVGGGVAAARGNDPEDLGTKTPTAPALADQLQDQMPAAGPSRSQQLVRNAFAEVQGDQNVLDEHQRQREAVALSLAQIRANEGDAGLVKAIEHLSGGDAAFAERLLDASEDAQLLGSARANLGDSMRFIGVNEAIRGDAGLIEGVEAAATQGGAMPADNTQEQSANTEPAPTIPTEFTQAKIDAIRDGLAVGTMVDEQTANELDITGLAQGIATGPDGRSMFVLAADDAAVQRAVQIASQQGLEAAAAAIETPVQGKAVIGGKAVSPEQAAGAKELPRTVQSELAQRFAQLPQVQQQDQAGAAPAAGAGESRPAPAAPAKPKTAASRFFSRKKAEPKAPAPKFTDIEQTGAVAGLVQRINAENGLQGDEQIDVNSVREVRPSGPLARLPAALRSAFGVNLVFVHAPQGMLRANGQAFTGFNGIADPSSRTIFLNIETNAALATLGHELAHILETQHPDLYDKLEMAVLSRMRESAAIELRDRLQAAMKSEGGKGSAAVAAEIRRELVAEGIGELAQDQSLWADVFGTIGENGTEAKTFYQLVLDVIAKLQRALTKAGLITGNKDITAVKKAVTEAYKDWAKRYEFTGNDRTNLTPEGQAMLDQFMSLAANDASQAKRAERKAANEAALAAMAPPPAPPGRLAAPREALTDEEARMEGEGGLPSPAAPVPPAKPKAVKPPKPPKPAKPAPVVPNGRLVARSEPKDDAEASMEGEGGIAFARKATDNQTKETNNEQQGQAQPAAAAAKPAAAGAAGGQPGAGSTAPGSLQAPERAVPAAEPQGQEPLSKFDPLPGAPKVEGFHGPDPRLVEVAESYAKSIGIELKRQAAYVEVDPARAARIAEAYAAMEHAPQDPKVREAYDNLIRQTMAQYRALEQAGYKFWFIDLSREDNQQYSSTPWNAMRDIRANRQMGVFPTEDGFGSGDTALDVSANPLLGDTGLTWPNGGPNGEPKRVLANDLFRAVHDAFGHGLEGSGFRAQGEENAWQAHVRLFTGSAIGAITSETRGQNSWLNYGPHGEKNRNAKVEDTVFADQKTGLMPEWTWTEGRAGDFAEPGSKVSFSRVNGGSAVSMFDAKEIEANRKPEHKSRVKMVDMRIDDFLALAEEGGGEEKARRVDDLMQRGEKFSSIPFLMIDLENRVDGHDGRHRARALKAAGYETMPVQLRMGGLRWSEQNDPDSFDYRETWPTTLQAEVKAKDPSFTIRFPVDRKDAMAPYAPAKSVVFSRTEQSELEALKRLSEDESLFRFPRGQGQTMQEVANSILPGLRVTGEFKDGNRTRYDLVLPEGGWFQIVTRDNVKGKHMQIGAYGFDTEDADPEGGYGNRPGEGEENPSDGRGDVWVNVSMLTPGQQGAAAYLLAADFAANTGRVFIGDPASITSMAVIRRTEQMLSSAIKWASTNHLAPHPRQLKGDAKAGIPPLTWRAGDTLGNIRSLVDTLLALRDNTSLPELDFDLDRGTFTDSSGADLDAEGLQGLATVIGGGRGTSKVGRATLARRTVLAALARAEGGRGGSSGERNGLLAQFGAIPRQNGALKGIFYSRAPLKQESTQEVLDLAKTGDLKLDLGDAIARGAWAEAYMAAKDAAQRGKLLRQIGDAVIERFADSKVRMQRWVEALPLAPQLKQRLLGDLRRADTRRGFLEGEVKEQFTERMFDAIARAAKATKMSTDQVKKLAGYHMTAKYAVEANAHLIQRDRAALAAAQQSGDQKAIAKAQQDLQDRLDDVNGAVGAPRKRGVAGGMNNAEALQYTQDAEARFGPNALQLLDDIAKPVYDMLDWKKRLDLASGRVTQAMVNSWLNSPRYVPLTGDPRADRESMDAFSAGGQINQDADKAMNGRTDSVADDGIDAAFTAVIKSINFSAIQDFKRTLGEAYKAAQQQGVDIGLKREPVTGVIRTSDDVIIHREASTTANGRQLVEAHAYRFKDDRIIQAIKKDNVEHMNSVLHFISVPTRWYARLVTQFMPFFAPVNFVRDIWERSELLRTRKFYDAAGNQIDADKVARAAIADTLNREVWKATIMKAFRTGGMTKARGDLEEMLRLGGSSTWGDYLNRASGDLEAAIRTETTALARVSDKVVGKVEGWNDAFELVPSLAIYRSLKAAGMQPKDAAATTLDLMNFRKRGTAMPALRALYMFAQPAATSGYNLAQYLGTHKGRVRFAAQVAIGTALYAFLRGIWGDDEDEVIGNKLDNLSNWTVERSIPVKMGDMVVKLPVGFGPPQLAWSTAGILNRWASGRYTTTDAIGEAAKGWMKSAAPVAPSDMELSKRPVDFFVQTFTPTIAKPLFNIYADQTSFGMPLTPVFKNPDMLKSEQMQRTTPPVFKDMATWLQQSIGVDVYPDQIKALVDGYVVGPFREILKVTVNNPAKELRGEPESLPLVASIVDNLNDRAMLNSVYARVRKDMEEGHRLYGSMAADPDQRALITAEQMDAEREYQRFKVVEQMIGGQRSQLAKRRDQLGEAEYGNRVQEIENKADEARRRLLVSHLQRKEDGRGGGI